MTCFGSVLNEMIEEMGDFLKDKVGFDEICHLALPMQVPYDCIVSHCNKNAGANKSSTVV